MKQSVMAFILLLILPLTASAETVQALVDRNRTQLDTPIHLTVSISRKGGTVDISVIQDFEVHSRGTSTRVEFINGRMNEEQTMKFLLVPKRLGTLTIPPLPVKVDGKTYQTEPIVIEVVQQGGEGSDEPAGIEVFSKVSEMSPYVGQQFVYTFLLRYGVDIANTQYSPPDFSGFAAKQIGEQQSRERVVSGRRNQEVELSYVLIPNKAGELTIGPAVLRCDAMDTQSRRGNARDRFNNDPFFSDSFFGNRRMIPRILRTEDIPLKVKPLPPEKGPVPFSGLVGQFVMDATLESAEVKVGDPTTLSITIKGSGNVMDAGVPVVKVPDAFKQYADSPQSEVQLGAGGYEGKKVFRLALVGVTPGDYQVVPAAMCYFDPAKESYQPLSVSPLSVRVLKPEGPAETPVMVSSPAEWEKLPEVQKKKVDFTGRDILPLKTGLDALESHRVLPGWLFIGSVLLPVLVFLIAEVVLRSRQKTRDPAAVMKQKYQSAIRLASKTVGDESGTFLSNLNRALLYAVCSVAKTSSESLTYEEAKRMLIDGGIPETNVERISDLLKKIDSARYGGVTLDPSDKNRLLTETVRLVKEVLK